MTRRGATTQTGVLWLGLAGAFVVGLLGASVLREGMSIFPAVVVGLVAAMWCRLDALQRGAVWAPVHTYFTFSLYPIAVPMYLLRSGRPRPMTAIALAVLYGIGAWLLLVAGFLMATAVGAEG